MRRRAFSLVELLVVVAIVALLLGILVPTLSSARKEARRAACLANMKTMQTASLAWTMERDGELIDVGLGHGGSGISNEQGSWINVLAQSYGSPLVRRCPADTSRHWSEEDGGRGEPVPPTTDVLRRSSYGVNDYLTEYAPNEPVRRLDRVRMPDKIVQFLEMAEEGEFAAADHPHVENWSVPGLPDASPKLAANEIESHQHGGKKATWEARSNVTFLDGHALSATFREVYTDAAANSFDPSIWE
ncbi:MAG: type II secretion system protein [Phycisphaerales bacterium]